MEAIKVDSILYKVSVGDYLHTYSLQKILWTVTREMVPIYTAADDPRAETRGKRNIAGALVPNVSILLDESITGYVVIHKDNEAVVLDHVKVLDEGSPCNRLVADCLMTFVAGKIVGDLWERKPGSFLFSFEVEK